MAAIEAGLAAGDARAVQRAAHGLKGNAQSLGASELAAAARQLEAAGETGQLDPAPALLAQLRDELAAVRAALYELAHAA